MLDYLFSWKYNIIEELLYTLKSFRKSSDSNKSYAWTFGKATLVAMGTPYLGLDPIETDDHVLIILGGPIPKFRDSDDKDAVWILDRWLKGEINWLEDFIGSFQFVRFDKRSGSLNIVTDFNGFVPVYANLDNQGVLQNESIIGSHADAVAKATKNRNVDKVSVVDFLLYQTVTYPHTLYKDVKQLDVASEIFCQNGSTPKSKSYYAPLEAIEDCNYLSSIKNLRGVLIDNVQSIASKNESVQVLMSGGEDSRIVLTCLPQGKDIDCITVSDSFNREAKIAKAVSNVFKSRWKFLHRPVSHYLDNAESSIKLSESHNFFYHAHFNGISHGIASDIPVLGGLMADALCKGCHAKQLSHIGITKFIDRKNWEYIGPSKRLEVSGEIYSKVQERREKWNRIVKEIRPNSWAEWHSLYPATMNTAATNYFVNRRLFFSYEPFVDSKIFQWSATTPTELKVNRKIFCDSMRPILNKTWYIPHVKGTYPFLGYQINGPLLFLLKKMKRVKIKISHKIGCIPKNETGWPNWKSVTANEKFKALNELSYDEKNYFIEKLGKTVFDIVQMASERPDPVQALAGLQIKLWLRSLYKPTDN